MSGNLANEDLASGVTPCPVGLRRHIFGSLKREEMLWTDLIEYLCHPEVKTDVQHINEVCYVIRQALQKQQPSIKRMSELYKLQPTALKTVAEVCNPARFGPYCDHYGLRAGTAFDLELGWNLLDPQQQNLVTQYLQSEKPGLVILSPPCTKFSPLQNLRMSTRFQSPEAFDRRLFELKRARKLLKFCRKLMDLCIQLRLNFVFEHPWSATSWQESCLKELVDREDVWLARGDQCMFGLKTLQGEPMRKRTGFLTNHPDIFQVLQKECDGSHTHQHVMGKEPGTNINRSTLAQKYPPPLVRAILRTYAKSIEKKPQELFMVTSSELVETDCRREQLLELCECRDLLPARPSSSTVPTGVALHPGQEAPTVLLGQVSHDEPGERSSAVLECGALDEEMEDAEREESPGKDFPGTHPLSLEALVKRAHEGLGHPSKERFLRILKYSKANAKVMEIARNLRCSVCDRFKTPKTSRAAAPPREIGVNDVVGMDTVTVRTHQSQKTKYVMNLIDYHSHFQMMIVLPDHTAQSSRWAYRQWIKFFGPPRQLLVDQGKEFKKEFLDAAEADGTEVIPSALETPEQRGLAERHGQIFKQMLYKAMEQVQCDNMAQWMDLVDITCFTKNRLLSRGGFSPQQRVTGYQQKIPGGLMSDGEHDWSVPSRIQAGDRPLQKAMEMRLAAAKAFHEADCEQAVRAAATHGPRPHLDFQVGQLVYFWRRGADARRRQPTAYWHGPARILMTQLPTALWLAYNGHLVKASPEKVRLASQEENLSMSSWLEGISNAKKQIDDKGNLKGYIDLSKEDITPPLTDDQYQPTAEDAWSQNPRYWIRLHNQPRESYYRPAEEDQPPFKIEDVTGKRISYINQEDGTSHVIEDEDWKRVPFDEIPIGGPWIGETWFEKKQPEEREERPLKRTMEERPMYRKCRQKTREEDARIIPPVEPIPERQADEPVIPEETPLPAVHQHPGEDQEPELPEEVPAPLPVHPGEGLPPEENRLEEPHKRTIEEVSLGGDWEEIPGAKRARIQLLEIYHLAMQKKLNGDQIPQRPGKKSPEKTVKDFQNKDFERLQRAIHKEINNNLGTGAYEIMSREESLRVLKEKSEKVMRSRYVITKKPVEEHAIEDARTTDDLLDNPEGPPAKAKCRHVMLGFSEENILDLETTTPQVHRDSVIFTAQMIVSNHWTPSYIDFTQAFHSGDAIERELYARQPKEGLPGTHPDQLLRLRKTCYGLVDGPAAWFKHITKFIIDGLGYRQSVVDPCLFFLDSAPDAEGRVTVEGIIALATDDILHGGSAPHHAKMDQIRKKYKLGKDTQGTGRFVGKEFKMLNDHSMIINQEFYVDQKVAEIPISKDRRKRKFSQCTAMEIEQLRGLIGTISWLAKETRCDLAGKVALLQQAFPRPQVKDLINANSLAKETIEHKNLGIRIKPIPMDRLQAGVVTDASWGNSKPFGTFLEGEKSEDTWEETSTSWIRVHKTPRTTAFHPLSRPDSPDVHGITQDRKTVIVTKDGEKIIEDEWTKSDSLRVLAEPEWTGRTIFTKQKGDNILASSEIHEGYDQLNRLFSQGGEMAILYDRDLPHSQSLQPVTICSWKSYRLKRRTVNTLSSETQALVRGLSAVHWLRVLILEAQGLQLSAREWQEAVKKLPFICVTDSKSLYDMIKKCMNPASQCEDKRTSIDVAIIKQELSELGGQIRWIDGRTMIADPLTKNAKADYLRHVLRTGEWSILEEGSALQRKLLERAGDSTNQEIWFVTV